MNQPTSPCLSEAHINQVLNGEELNAVLDDHLLHCDRCQAALENRFLAEHQPPQDSSSLVNAPLSKEEEETVDPQETIEIPDRSAGNWLDDQAPENLEFKELPFLVDEFEFQELIGRGGMGQVFRCFDRKLKRECAIKTIRREHFSNEERIARFEAECTSAAKLNHESIIKVYAVREYQRQLLLIMEYVPGKNLANLRTEKKFAPGESARIIRQLTEAVQHAHDHQVVHRDIKPANILRTADGRICLVDFGLAKDMNVDKELTQAGAIIGTLGFMAPEQTDPRAEIGNAADIYALGAVLYYLLIGRPPFESDDLMVALEQIRVLDPIALRKFDPNIPRDLESICLKCLEKDPARRYSSAKELGQDLDRFLNNEPTVARPISWLDRTVRWIRRNPAVASVLFVLFLLVAVLSIGSPIIASQKVRLAELQKQHELAELSVLHSKELVQLQSRLTEAWIIKSIFDHTTNDVRLNRQSSLFHAHIFPEQQRSLDWKILESLQKQFTTDQDHSLFGIDEILECRYSPDGKYLAALNGSGIVTLLDATSGKILKQLTESVWDNSAGFALHYRMIFSNKLPDIASRPVCLDFCWDPDSRSILTCRSDGSVQRISQLDQDRPVVDSMFQTEGQLVSIERWKDRTIVGDLTGKLTIHAAKKTVATVALDREEIVDIRSIQGTSNVVVHQPGKLVILDVSEGRKLMEIETDFDIWDFDIHRSAQGDRIWVCGTAPVIDEFQIDLEAGTVISRERIPLRNLAGLRVESLVYDPRKDRLLVLDDSGTTTAFSINGDPIRSIDRKVKNDRVIQITEPNKFRAPVLLRSRLTRVRISRRPGYEILLAGHNAGISFFNLPAQPARIDAKSLNTSLKQNAEIEFDPEVSDYLWALTGSGHLNLVDIRGDRILDTVLAHEGGAFNGIKLTKHGIATSGGDGCVRLWKRDENRIQAAGVLARTDAGLMSLDYSPEKDLLASVDVNGKLWVWQRESGNVEFGPIAVSEHSGRPATGKLSFSCDGELLATCGTGQHVAIFKTRDWVRSSSRPEVAGGGGSAIRFSPLSPTRIILADGRAVNGYDVAEPERQLQEIAALNDVYLQGEDLAITHDGKRVVLLGRMGRLRFFEAASLVPVFSLDLPILNCRSLAFSADGCRLAVCNQSGTLQVIDSRSPDERKSIRDFEDCDRTPWTETTLIESEDPVVLNSKNIHFDKQNRVRFAWSRRIEGNTHQDSRLFLVREQDGRFESEQICFGDNRFSDRVHQQGYLYEFRNGTEAVFLRQREDHPHRYAATLYLGIRHEGQRDWQTSTVFKDINAGFKPVMQWKGDRVATLFCECTGGYRLLMAKPSGDQDPPGRWNCQFVFPTGHGVNSTQGIQDGDFFYFVTVCRRFNGDFGKKVIVLMDDKEKKIHRIPITKKFRALRRTNSNDLTGLDTAGQFWKFDPHSRSWIKMNIPKIDFGELRNFDIDPQGNLYLLYYLNSDDSCLLRIHDGGIWKSLLVHDFSDQRKQNNFFHPVVMLNLDRKQQPVVFTITKLDGRHSVKMYRCDSR